MGTSKENAARPITGVSCVRISSVPYAEDEMQSDDSTPNAATFESRSPASCSET
jgi:hypothetical protein